jgi:predicted ester cyclase
VHEAVVAWFGEHLGSATGPSTPEATRPSTPEATRPSAPAALARLFYETFDHEGPARAAEFLHADCRTHFSGAPAVDRDTWVGASNAFHGAFAGFRHGVAEQVAEGDLVVTRGVMSGRHVGTFQGVPATDREVAFGWMGMLRVVDAQVVEQRIEMDALGLMQQLTGPARPAGALADVPQGGAHR